MRVICLQMLFNIKVQKLIFNQVVYCPFEGKTYIHVIVVIKTVRLHFRYRVWVNEMRKQSEHKEERTHNFLHYFVLYSMLHLLNIVHLRSILLKLPGGFT